MNRDDNSVTWNKVSCKVVRTMHSNIRLNEYIFTSDNLRYMKHHRHDKSRRKLNVFDLVNTQTMYFPQELTKRSANFQKSTQSSQMAPSCGKYQYGSPKHQPHSEVSHNTFHSPLHVDICTYIVIILFSGHQFTKVTL